jgi:hypothetical protein
MTVQIESESPGATEAQLQVLSTGVGGLPDSYVQFLRRHNGVVPAPNRFDVRPRTAGSLRRMFGAETTLDRARMMRSEFGAAVVPIGEAEGGNLVCLSLDDGHVIFWDHDRWGPDGMTPIAPSVDDFMAMLKPL